MFEEKEIRNRLINSMHSSVEDNLFFESLVQNNDLLLLDVLIEIAGDQDDYGDAAIAASLYIKDYEAEALKAKESLILRAFQEDDRNARLSLSIALAKLKNIEARSYIYKFYDEVPSHWMIAEAVRLYEEPK